MFKGLINEKHLITMLNQGCEDAFSELFEAYSPVLVSFTAKLNIDAEDIHDTVQQTFLKVWENREKLDPNVPLKNYIITVAKNDIYNKIQRNLVARRHHEFLADAQQQPAEDLNSELPRILRQILDTLPEKRAKVFKMSRLQGYSNKEISEELGISKSTVENHINNSTATIKRILKNFGFCITVIIYFILS
uniref:RNA polymerase sigma-70 factor n=1 Tax=Pedobacter schmidteae TaxID=2201271 RepID=UPI000EAFEB6C|nr:RNA polymerase sigma-70 factor [Pedobacter schmidteae]